MKIIQTTIALIALLVTGLFACSSSVDESKKDETTVVQQHVNDAKKLPAFTMQDVNGRTVNLSSFQGKKVFVNLWATWCPPCREEIPSIEKLYSQVDKEKTVFIMLSLDNNFEVAKKFAAAQGLEVPVYYPAEKIPALFNTDGIPATFIFNENGDLVKHNNGADDYGTNEYINLLNGK